MLSKWQIVFCILIFCGNWTWSEVSILKLDNQIIQGELVDFSHEPAAHLVIRSSASVEEEQVFCENIVKISFDLGNSVSLAADLAKVILNDGSVVYGKLKDGDEKSLILESELLSGNFTIELTKISEIFFEKEIVEQEYNTDFDRLSFKSGDVLDCFIESFGKGYLEVQHDQLGKITEYFNKLRHIKFSLLEPYKKENIGLTANVIGIDGSSLSGKILSLKNDMLELEVTYLNQQLHIPLNRIKYIFFKNGRLSYLSDFPKKAYQTKYIAYFPGGGSYRPLFDQNIRGGTIELSGQKFHKGIGVIPHTEIAFYLGGKFKKFQSYIGLDDEVRRRYQNSSTMIGGSVVFKVLLDNEPVYTSSTLYWFSPPQSVDIDVTGKKVITLIVSFAENGGINDMANWGGARLIK